MQYDDDYDDDSDDELVDEPIQSVVCIPLPWLASGILSRTMRQASNTCRPGSNCIVLTTLLPTTLTRSDSVAMVISDVT